MGNILRNWDRMDDDKRATIRREEKAILKKLENGERV